jgi:hypothetical protein
MSIGKRKSGGGNFDLLLRYDARHGAAYLCDRVRQPDGTWQTEQKTINNFTAVFDLPNIEIGWMAFASNGPPSFKMVKADMGADIGAAPSPKHKEGFRLRLKLKGDGGSVREFSSTAAATWQGVDKLHTAFLEEHGKHPGKLPLVKLTGTSPIKSPMGLSHEPNFQITDWVDRPPELPAPAIADLREDDEEPPYDVESAA